MNGTAFGAVTILNATATGRGCSLAVAGGVNATWAWGGDAVIVTGAPDARLAEACHAVASRQLGIEEGASIATTAIFPPARGLKTSSSAATAMLRAAGVPEGAVEAGAVEAARAAGVTLTGAFDDQVAVTRGGCHLTDNKAQQVLATFHPAPWHVAIWVPDASISKASVPPTTAALATLVEAAEDRLLADDIPEALTRNGAAYLEHYQQCGMPVDGAPVDAALRVGALGAGLSGTGPAVAALFDEAVELPFVPGGMWAWTHVEAGA